MYSMKGKDCNTKKLFLKSKKINKINAGPLWKKYLLRLPL